MRQELLRQIPSMEKILAQKNIAVACGRYSRALVKRTIQDTLGELRAEILAGSLWELPSPSALEEAILRRLDKQEARGLQRVINGTGIALHTNLGRAPLGNRVARRVCQVAAGYCNLEYDLNAGSRGNRGEYVEEALCRLTGGEAALVVNNNAGAVFLMLHTLAQGRKVAVSRGELVEIGGSFRMPDVMEQSGAVLTEVGSTNKTRLEDYEKAILEKEVSLLLKVHPSNFIMTGFTESADLPQLAALARRRGCVLLYDAGAAFLDKPENLPFSVGFTVRDSLRAGADLISFSGDKLLGSCQAGVLIGKKEYVEQIRKNPLTRMLRIDKLCLAALEESLRVYQEGPQGAEALPLFAMARQSGSECRQRAEALAVGIQKAAPALSVELVSVWDEIGGGALPGVRLEGWALKIGKKGVPAARLEHDLRCLPTPIIARIHQDSVLLSVRTLFKEDEAEICAALKQLSSREESV